MQKYFSVVEHNMHVLVFPYAYVMSSKV